MFALSSIRLSRPMLAASLLLGIAIPTLASGAPRVLFVANNGVDSINCGDAANRCRSIGQAIDNAVDGDHIKVGPGRYGDLNRDGDMDDPGEETPRARTVNGTFIINVNKRLSIYSQNGAATTTIDASSYSANELMIVVNISANGVIFGRPNGGFTIIGANRANLIPGLGDHAGVGLRVHAGNVQVVGNIALYNLFAGFEFIAENGRIVATDNLAAENQYRGFYVDGAGANHVELYGDIASDNDDIGMLPGNGKGFFIEGSGHVLMNCRSTGNGYGIVESSLFHPYAGSSNYVRNTVTANVRNGFVVIGAADTFLENSVIGNGGSGFLFTGEPAGTVVRRNNIYGNGRDLDAIPDNCGIQNDATVDVDARQNYWGAPTGPGGDPADNAGPGCSLYSSLTITTRFATNKFPIN